jgi:hypothetical protein
MKGSRVGACVVRGTVASGRGEAKDIFGGVNIGGEMPALQPLFPGSLNLLLNFPLRLHLSLGKPFSTSPRFLWHARLKGSDIPVYVYRWKGCPLHVLELVSPIQLRTALGLHDGSVVELELLPEMISNVGWISHCWWTFLWKGRGSWYYTHERYKRTVYASRLHLFAAQ